jgi:hypothetical protein
MKTLTEQLKKRITSVEAAYKETGRPKVDFSVFPEDLRLYEKGHYDAIVLIEAARKIEKENGKGEIDWTNSNQYKWLPWFRMSPSAFAFCGSFYDHTNAGAGSGSRLRVLSEESSDYLRETFPEVWEIVQLK